MKNTHLHPTQSHANELAEICRPLEKLNITYFGHAQINDQGHFAALNNNPEFMQFYLNKRYYNADIHMAKQTQLGHFVIWDNIALDKEGEKLKCEAVDFGVDHTFTIIERNCSGMQYYHFSTSIGDQSINQENLRHIDLLKHFIAYFHEQVKSSKNLNDAYATTFALAANSSSFLAEETTIRELFLQDLKRDSSQTISRPNTFNNTVRELVSNYGQNKLTSREIDCLCLTLQGKTAKLVGQVLGISRRTVEEYLSNIKTKVGVFSKSELIEKIILTPNYSALETTQKD